ncbi:MAG TPA: TrmJ/YjtD family RNA methyltransferase [Candidatus Limnocylindrales bacterium]|nr:TrmJ/YjtD family RNA methyltransferase [Candidatus Limnocylindrales bacterium]
MLRADELDRLCVLLVATRNPLNIGAVARAMSNFGFSRLRVVRPYEPTFREARSAVGAAQVLAEAQEYSTVADAVADCVLVVGTTAAHNRQVQHPLKLLRAGAGSLREKLQEGRVALLFGSEKTGLSNEDLAHCHWLVRIPTVSEHASMNLGQAVALCLYEIAHGAEPGELEQQRTDQVAPANAGQAERLTTLLLEALRASGYVRSGSGGVTEEKIRRLVRRLRLSSTDAELMMGMLQQILWKARSGH